MHFENHRLTCAPLNSDSFAMGILTDQLGYFASFHKTRTIIGNLTNVLDEIKTSRKLSCKNPQTTELESSLTERNRPTELPPRCMKKTGKYPLN